MTIIKGITGYTKKDILIPLSWKFVRILKSCVNNIKMPSGKKVFVTYRCKNQ